MPTRPETQTIVSAFQRYIKNQDITEIENFTVAELQAADEDLGARDKNSSYRLALKNRIATYKEEVEEKGHHTVWASRIGVYFAGATFIFLMILVFLEVFEHGVPCNARFLVTAIFAIGVGMATTFMGGSAAVEGNVPFSSYFENHPFQFSLGGGAAIVAIILMLGNEFYSSSNCNDIESSKYSDQNNTPNSTTDDLSRLGSAVCIESAGGGPMERISIPLGRMIKVVNPGEDHNVIVQYYSTSEASDPTEPKYVPAHEGIEFFAHKNFFYFNGHCTIDNQEKHAPVNILLMISNNNGNFDNFDIPHCTPINGRCNPDS